ncbi:MAG: site-2 protease family protein [Betaproteobacteria bacterium]|nr:site-2 protease family protein [Betaproteobacteria bacterium]MDE2046846.1 site-2 protease family protein [Betaproteobacteria bacterium]
MDELIQKIAVFGIPVLFAITLHEAAHGYVASRLGDRTALMLGRVTLNPMKHIDPIGTIAMPIFLYLATGGSFVFGYAKPVPVNFGNLNNPRRDTALVALAGPASNYLQALLWGVVVLIVARLGVEERFFYEVAKAGVLVNLVMAVFNLFPLPPLDGGRILASLLPYRQAAALGRLEPYGFFIVMALVLEGIVGRWWMRPLMTLSYTAINLLLSPVRALLG